MNKRFIAVILVLLIAVGGVFAALKDDTVTATLTGSVGEFLFHGFTTEAGQYQPSDEKFNVFEEIPKLTYGYYTNSTSGLEFRMEVGDFINDDESSSSTIGIASVKRGASPLTKAEGEDYYVIFSRTGTEGTMSVFADFTITAADHEGADAGTYVSIVKIDVETV